MYLDYISYLSLGGNLDEPIFKRMEYKAEILVNKYTFGRLRHDYIINPAVKMAVFELINLVYKKDNILTYGNGNSCSNDIISYSNDGVSVSLNKETVSQFLETYNARVAEIIKNNLNGEKNQNGAPLLFRGYCPKDFLPHPEPPKYEQPIEPDTPDEQPGGVGKNESDRKTTTTHF